MTAAFILASLLTIGRADDRAASFEPTDRYASRTIEGWPVLVSRALLDEPDLADPTLELLRVQLFQITRVVPAEAVAKLRTVTIWVENAEPHHPCMAYHPSAGWLREHGMNPDKARGVELANARRFLDWTKDQPWMVFHELAHAYHDRVLGRGYGNEDLRKAHERAVAAELYGEVLYINGHKRSHYAATNPMEFFAEASEAYFGTNDFYPFVRPELKAHDPETHALIGRLWGVPAENGDARR